MRTTSAALTIAVLLALVPVAAAAATVQDIVALSRAGVSDTVILALIERDQTIFSLDSGQIADLHSEGLSEDVIVAMLRSGRQSPVGTAAELPSTAPSVPPPVAPGPDSASAGYALPYAGPAPYPYAVPPGQPYAMPYAVPYFIPYPVTVPRGRIHQANTAPLPPAAAAALGRSFVSSRGMFFTNPSGSRGMFFTEPR